MKTIRRLLGAAIGAMAGLLIATQGVGAGTQPDVPTHAPYIAGQLLVATAKMGDPRFHHAVIYMINHDAQGAMGLVVNHSLGKGPLAKLLKAFGADSKGVTGDILLHYGGPVEMGQGFVLHSTDYKAPGDLIVNSQFALSTGIKVLKDIGRGKGPKHSLFALGYAGWGPGQLERELARDDWLTAPADVDLVFSDAAPEATWEKAMQVAGIGL